jgi:hypothetical protein
VEFDGLSIVDEETETVSNDVTPVDQGAEDNLTRQARVSFGGVKGKDSDICGVISNRNQVDSACFNNPNARHRHEQQFFGKIKLPNGKEGVFMSDAVLPNSSNISSGLPIYGDTNLKGNSYDLGPITGFNPNDYHILNENVWSEIPATSPGVSQNVAHSGPTMFPPPQSHYNYTFTPVDPTLLSNGASAQDSCAFGRSNEFSGLPDADALFPNFPTYRDTRTEHAYLERGDNTVLHDYGVNDDMYFGMGENIDATTATITGEIIPDYYHKRGGPDVFISGAYPVAKSPGSFPAGGNLDQLLKQMNNRENENVPVVSTAEVTGFGTAVDKPESDVKELPQKDDAQNVSLNKLL